MRNVTRVLVGRMEDTVDLRATENVQLYCPFSGIEEPTVIWLREGRDGAPHELVRPSPRIKLEKITLAGFTTSILSISNLQDGDFGEYVCHVHNKAGTDYDTVTLRGQ